MWQDYLVRRFGQSGQVETQAVGVDDLGQTQVHMGEPSLVNPNSYVTINQVLKHIQQETLINRSWTVAGCDRVPYILAHRLRDKDRELQNILLLPGPGHVEMNAIRVLFKLLWPLGMEDLARILGYKTPKALGYAQKAADDHKAWEMLEIYFKSLMIFALTPYQQECQAQGILSTLGGAEDFWKHKISPSLFLAVTICNRYVLSLLMYRKCIRMGQSQDALLARDIVSEMFYSNNMTMYMELHRRDVITRIKAPPEVRTILARNHSFRISPNAGKREGGDFILEGKNRRTKMFLPPGTPTHAQWQRTSRILKPVEEVCIISLSNFN